MHCNSITFTKRGHTNWPATEIYFTQLATFEKINKGRKKVLVNAGGEYLKSGVRNN